MTTMTITPVLNLRLPPPLKSGVSAGTGFSFSGVGPADGWIGVICVPHHLQKSAPAGTFFPHLSQTDMHLQTALFFN
jgi:hypothetical protein